MVAENDKLKVDMVMHFHNEHLHGDGPEIDRWKRQNKEWIAENERLTSENSVLREQNSAMNASLVKLRTEVERLKKDRCGKQWGCLLYVPTKQPEGDDT